MRSPTATAPRPPGPEALPPPRSVYLAFEVFPRPKGASSHIASMVSALSRQHGPTWVLCCGHGDMPAFQREGDVVILRCMDETPNMLARAEAFGRFVHETLSRVPEGVEVCVFRDPWGGAAALASGLGTRFVFEVNALPSWELGYRYPRFRRHHATRAKLQDLERLCLREAEAVLTVSPVTREALEGIGVPRERITTVTNAASPLFFEARAEDCPLPLLERGRWIGYVGSLHPWQGVEVAVEAWNLVESEFPEVGLVIVHSGRKKPYKRVRARALRAGARLGERVHFQMPLSHEELAPTLARCEFTLAPLVETFRNCVQGCCPVKVIESMAAGTPVLASDLRVHRNLLDHDVEGRLVPPGDPRALALAMRDLLRDAGARRRLGAASRARAQAEYSWSRVHAAMAPVFRGGPDSGEVR